MKILADYHHSDLFESYMLTLHDRLGYEVYRPIGMEWFDSGIWQFEKHHHGDAVAHQYLDIWGTDRDCGDYWERDDTTHPGRVLRMVTLDQARAQDWDIIISSLPDNDVGMAALAREKGAKFGVQIGNEAQHSAWELADFGLVSASMPYQPPKPFVIYHQEFRLSDFRWEWPDNRREVGSWVQCFPENAVPYAEFLDIARVTPDFDWRIYGAYGTHPIDEYACGNLPNTPAVAKSMRQARIAFHAKSWSDGYGHVIHNIAATGRPLIGRASYYADKLAGPLWAEGVTSFDLDSHSRDELVAIMRRLRDDDEYWLRISENMLERFEQVVNFEEDAAHIKGLLGA